MNSRAITGCKMFCSMHILTRESQEVMEGVIVLTTDMPPDNDGAIRSVTV